MFWNKAAFPSYKKILNSEETDGQNRKGNESCIHWGSHCDSFPKYNKELQIALEMFRGKQNSTSFRVIAL